MSDNLNDNLNDTLIVIPARYGSTRLPAKVLEEIEGKTILQWVYSACKAANCGEVIIATENEKIVEAAAKFGAKAMMTSEACQSGTDRVFEVAQKTQAKYILNVQGDEPFVAPATIAGVVKLLKDDEKVDISTACVPTLDTEAVNNPNHVKAVLNYDKRALYFSRSVVPYKREQTEETLKEPYFIHCGIYGFKRDALEKFVKLPKSALESLEKLEQLRALEAGMTIKTILINKAGPAIDTLQDLVAAKEYIKKNK
ncbi:MAG: 3-deoxy-manno-octulosonate cytidylyltransferase [Elusimicrobiota bacterium]|jgi:3-deoxy-manno-octulosonate cytidylyltransferase (CMP-KDO synthetase)|nr:3-deoxy-manno-octulosonate cytidylyltransferase [Elusimicrobiota bacterium]